MKIYSYLIYHSTSKDSLFSMKEISLFLSINLYKTYNNLFLMLEIDSPSRLIKMVLITKTNTTISLTIKFNSIWNKLHKKYQNLGS